MRVGVDTGGTFTDVVLDDGTVQKRPSSPGDTSRATVDALSELPSAASVLCHGTTVATNALLERRGATVALVTNRGFADVIEIARQDRPSLYDQWADRPPPLVERALRFEVAGRLDANGGEIEPLDLSSLAPVPGAVGAVAVCLLHADLNATHERAVAGALAARGLAVVCSHEVTPEFREYERTLTTVVNAYLAPVVGTHLEGLVGVAGAVLVMASSGGLLGVDAAAAVPAALLLSGPAAGVRAAAAAAAAAGFSDAVSFDMGGTSTDVCLIRGGVPEAAPGRVIAGFAVRLPALDIHTIGAGGGSIASIDPGGALVVGPASAGAWTGPACYGRGGANPTVTDADVVLGRIDPAATFPGLGRLDAALARNALSATGVSADGVVAVVDAAMEGAVRRVTVERGVDPRDVALVAFGGAGPLHACAVAEALGMPAVVVPPRAGVLSAVGLLVAPEQRDLVRSWPVAADHGRVPAELAALGEAARAALGGDPADIDVVSSVDCRYAGQSHELTVPSIDKFATEHRRRNGYELRGAPVEVVALRASARRASPMAWDDFAPASRRPAKGPCSLAEPDCTVWVPDGWRADVHDSGAWVLHR